MRNTMQLGESINTYDPAIALRDEYGTFLVITPGGEELLITCKPGQTVAGIHWADQQQNRKPFLVTKVSEPANVKGVTPITQAA